MASYDATIKIMLLGDESTEKTPLTLRFIPEFFLDDLKLTIGVDFYSKILNLDNKKIKLQIWHYCRKAFTKEELLTHVCQKKPKN